MTAPIQEPSVYRTQSGHTWGISQLARRPMPAAGAFVVPCLRAYQWDVSQTITDNNRDFLMFDRYEVSDASILDIAGWVAGTPDFFRIVEFQVRALWLISVNVALTTIPGAGSIGVALEDAISVYAAPPQMIQPATFLAGDIDTGYWTFPFIVSYPPIWIEQTTDALAPALPQMRFYFFNGTGGSVTTSQPETSLEIHCLYQFDYETLTILNQA